jgi:hypothetical protein
MHLPHHRRSRTLGDHLLRGLANALAAGILLEAVILATAGTHGVPAAGSGDGAWSQVDQPRAPEVRLIRQYDCSTIGYADSVTPQSAIVRSPAGRVRVVSFDKGWSAYAGNSRATLVAVCLEPPRQQR